VCATKRTKDSLSLELTERQRQALIKCGHLYKPIQDRLKRSGEGTQLVSFTPKQVNQILNEARFREGSTSGSDQASLRSIVKAVTEVLDRDALPGRVEGKSRSKKLAPSNVYQLKITLRWADPPIWRNIQTRECTLDELHYIIQVAMGWENGHLHQFKVGSRVFGDPEILGGDFDAFDGLDSHTTWLHEILEGRKKGYSFEYEYDFGDGWIHDITFEQCTATEKTKGYPRCVDGRRACPPEDVGGVWGYDRLLAALADKREPEHDGYVGWIGKFDPERFSPTRVNKDMRKVFG
jgi:hypothetical protein